MTDCQKQPEAGFRDFDLQTRGAVDVVEQWKQNRDDVRAVWKVEDFVALYNGLFAHAQSILQHYQECGSFPHANVRFSYFVDATGRFLIGARCVDTLVAAVESQGYQVSGASEFRDHIANFADLLEDEGVACRAFAIDDIS